MIRATTISGQRVAIQSPTYVVTDRTDEKGLPIVGESVILVPGLSPLAVRGGVDEILEGKEAAVPAAGARILTIPSDGTTEV